MSCVSHVISHVILHVKAHVMSLTSPSCSCGKGGKVKREIEGTGNLHLDEYRGKGKGVVMCLYLSSDNRALTSSEKIAPQMDKREERNKTKTSLL